VRDAFLHRWQACLPDADRGDLHGMPF
jgi:hypothetical protein